MNAYVGTKSQQIAVEAENLDEALKKIMAGEGTSSGISLNVQLRPPAPARPQPGVVTQQASALKA